MFKIIHLNMNTRKGTCRFLERDHQGAKNAGDPIFKVVQHGIGMSLFMIYDDAIIPEGYDSAQDAAKDQLENSARQHIEKNLKMWQGLAVLLDKSKGE